MFVIEDELHAESVGEFETLEEAILEVKRLARIPWGTEPNQAPCSADGKTCERIYEILEYDRTEAGKVLQTIPILRISEEGVLWEKGFSEY